ncbi:thiol-disulfide oxidoreductase LTO1-like [Quillaja saponaria]|uniref:Thiol-disulfide oxidoreductase LTO1-like n=1 Tax=Quillaja saponaria TaxID=32244 RepID=A0AAD7P6U3_QUISA|nr:thiol-disulfide oxidoreductase LTO1-like [Quillaja saponaria]
MASFLNLSVSSSPFLSRWQPIRSNSSVIQGRLDFVGKSWHQRLMLLPLKCLSSGSGPGQESEPEAETPNFPLSSSSSSSNFTYNLCAAIGGIGFFETTYLTYLKLTNSDAFCPIGGGTCGDILNSDYAFVFGVPLPLIGMAAYGLVATLGLQLTGDDLPFGVSKSNARLMLLGCTTSMAASSAYFLYILSTKFAGSSCSYCLISAMLSFSLFFITLKMSFGLLELQKFVALQICIASLVIVTLNTSYSASGPASSSLAEIELPYYSTEITTPSNHFALSLARHLHSIGAKMYGAFWCSHCLEQKQMFGHEAAALLDYVECFPEGYRKGTKIVKACTDAGIEGFPTWVINGQVLSGEQELSELAQISGFNESVQPS